MHNVLTVIGIRIIRLTRGLCFLSASHRDFCIIKLTYRIEGLNNEKLRERITGAVIQLESVKALRIYFLRSNVTVSRSSPTKKKIAEPRRDYRTKQLRRGRELFLSISRGEIVNGENHTASCTRGGGGGVI